MAGANAANPKPEDARSGLAPSDWSGGSVLMGKACYLRLPNWMTTPPMMMSESPTHVEAGIDSLKM